MDKYFAIWGKDWMDASEVMNYFATTFFMQRKAHRKSRWRKKIARIIRRMQ